jgi:hypothetical protein
MFRTFLFLCFLLSLTAPAFGQTPKIRPFSRVIFGSQYGYVPQNTTELSVPDPEGYRFHEHLWTNYVLLNVSRSWVVGFDYMFIFTRSTETGDNRFYYAGANVQYNFLSLDSDRHRFYAETGLRQSNYCACDPEPYKKEKLWYATLGLGYSYRVFHAAHLALRLPVLNFALNGPKGFHGFHYMTLGVEFRL